MIPRYSARLPGSTWYTSPLCVEPSIHTTSLRCDSHYPSTLKRGQGKRGSLGTVVVPCLPRNGSPACVLAAPDGGGGQKSPIRALKSSTPYAAKHARAPGHATSTRSHKHSFQPAAASAGPQSIHSSHRHRAPAVQASLFPGSAPIEVREPRQHLRPWTWISCTRLNPNGAWLLQPKNGCHRNTRKISGVSLRTVPGEALWRLLPAGLKATGLWRLKLQTPSAAACIPSATPFDFTRIYPAWALQHAVFGCPNHYLGLLLHQCLTTISTPSPRSWTAPFRSVTAAVPFPAWLLRL